jgi:hypothetical protein
MNISVFNLVSGASPKTEPNLSTNLFEDQNKKHKLDTSISKTPDTTIYINYKTSAIVQFITSPCTVHTQTLVILPHFGPSYILEISRGGNILKEKST